MPDPTRIQVLKMLGGEDRWSRGLRDSTKLIQEFPSRENTDLHATSHAHSTNRAHFGLRV